MRVEKQLLTVEKSSGRSRQSDSLIKRVNLLSLQWGSGERGVDVDEKDDDE
jgi:hypothetical protein